MTKEEKEKLVQEYIKCKSDFEYFCRNYIVIELPGGDVYLNPYKEQLKLIKTIEQEKTVLVLKSRQIGISTIVQAYITWLTTFFDNVVVGIISKDGPEATSFARNIMSMLDKLPKWMTPGFKKRTEQTFILSNGSKVYATPVNPSTPEKTLRGKAITFLVIDEAAFVPHIEEAWTGMVSALATSQKHARQNGIPYGTVLLSTPNKTEGVGKWFFTRYQKALSNSDIFKLFKIHWKDIPELANDPSWYETQRKLFGYDEKAIKQELDLVFLPGSGSFFSEEICEKLQSIDCKPIEVLKLFNGEWWKFKQPEKGKYYLIGVDTAGEHGEDNSAITVWDYVTLEQVCEYQGKCSVTDFTKVVALACAQYSGIVVVENNSYGNQVCEALDRSEFAPMLYKEKRSENKVVTGLSTNSKTRPLMIDSLYSYIAETPEIVKSRRLALELVGLVSKASGRVEGDEGCRDDLALATACAFYVRKYDPPLAISLAGEKGNILDKVLNLNVNENLSSFTNEDIAQFIKENIAQISAMGGSFINTLQFYDGSSQLQKLEPMFRIKKGPIDLEKDIDSSFSFADYIDLTTE
jgi:hypothetical protein